MSTSVNKCDNSVRIQLMAHNATQHDQATQHRHSKATRTKARQRKTKLSTMQPNSETQLSSPQSPLSLLLLTLSLLMLLLLLLLLLSPPLLPPMLRLVLLRLLTVLWTTSNL